VLLGDAKALARAKATVQSFKLPSDALVALDAKTIFALKTFASDARFVGRSGDASMLALLLRYLDRPKDVAKNVGYREAVSFAAEAAIDGLAEWGPDAAKAVDKLVEDIRDPGQGAVARRSAGRALGRIASDAELLARVKEARAWNDPEAQTHLLTAALQRSNGELSAAALDFVVKKNEVGARVVGASEVAPLAEPLLALLNDPGTRPFAALAIMLGGDDDLVTRGMNVFAARARSEGRWEKDRDTLRALFVATFDQREVVAADLAWLSRVARNVDRMRRLGPLSDVDDNGRGPHAWAALAFEEALTRLDLAITVPGALDRALFLVAARRTGDVRLLRYLRETGALLALGSERARRALREVR
jgi:hypothetical protein